MDLSIIIVNYNVYHDLKNCLSSIIEKIAGLSYEIIVVDNNSADRSVENLSTEFPGVKLIGLEENVGFGRANNKGAESAKGKYLLLLNPDTLIPENFVTPIINFIDSDNSTGACGPMLLNENGSYQDSTGFRIGLLYELFESLMLIELYRKIKRAKYLRLKNSEASVQVGWISAACMLISRDCFLKVMGFSPEYFLNYEDLELCRKLEEAGFKNYFFPFLKCYHLDHRSFGSNYCNLIFSRYESRLTFAEKNYNIAIRFVFRLLILSGLMMRLALVNIFSSGIERTERTKGYYKSLRLGFTRSL